MIFIIDPAIRTPTTSACEKMAGLAPVAVIRPALEGTAGLSAINPDTLKGIVILGSAASVNDTHVWLTELEQWLHTNALPRRIPMLGICFGHQLLAKLLGGRVGRLYPNAIRGIRPVTIPAASLSWWPDHPTPLHLFYSHGEEVLDVPPGVRVLATSRITLPDGQPHDVVEMLAHETLPIWSFQTHPEATETFVTEQRHGHLLDTPELAQCFLHGWGVVEGFIRYCLLEDRRTGSLGLAQPQLTINQ